MQAQKQPIVFRSNSEVPEVRKPSAFGIMDVFPFCNLQNTYNKHDLADANFNGCQKLKDPVRYCAWVLKHEFGDRRVSGHGVVDFFTLVEYLYPNHFELLLRLMFQGGAVGAPIIQLGDVDGSSLGFDFAPPHLKLAGASNG